MRACLDNPHFSVALLLHPRVLGRKQCGSPLHFGERPSEALLQVRELAELFGVAFGRAIMG